MNELYIEKGDYIDKIAYQEEGDLKQFDFIDKTKSVYEGDIYLGVVKKILKGMDSALVDLGNGATGFLQEKNLSQTIKNGQELLVQIKRQGINSKHPKLTKEISIVGRYVVLLPYSKGINISNKIQDTNILNDVKNEMKEEEFEDAGVIIRTISSIDSLNSIKKEINELKSLWKEKSGSYMTIKAPKMLIRQYDPYEKFIMKINPVKINKIISNDKDSIKIIKDKFKNKIEIEEFIYKDDNFLFENYGINKSIKHLFEKKVELKNGSSLYIESLEAFHIIDVNGSRDKNAYSFEQNALNINLSSCREIVRQIILRDLSGIILIDFVDMKAEENKNKLIQKMKNLLKDDHKRVSVISITELGIMQIIRKRDQEDIISRYTNKCSLCKGTGRTMSKDLLIQEISLEIENKVSHSIIKNITIDIPHRFDENIEQALKEMEKKYNIQIYSRYLKNTFNEITINLEGILDKG